MILQTSSEEKKERRRSEEHTSELQSQSNLVCPLLLEKKNVWLCGEHARHDPLVVARQAPPLARHAPFPLLAQLAGLPGRPSTQPAPADHAFLPRPAVT